jgi:hypothetical protein
MYPTGVWRGYWEAAGWGRQEMQELVLRFADGKVTGDGVDRVGRFTFRGTYEPSGTVTLVKQYIGRHQVIYQGQHDGEGTIFGRWTIPPLGSGPFALAPVTAGPPADTPIPEFIPPR